jgi:hypothetical protein
MITLLVRDPTREPGCMPGANVALPGAIDMQDSAVDNNSRRGAVDPDHRVALLFSMFEMCLHDFKFDGFEIVSFPGDEIARAWASMLNERHGTRFPARSREYSWFKGYVARPCRMIDGFINYSSHLSFGNTEFTSFQAPRLPQYLLGSVVLHSPESWGQPSVPEPNGVAPVLPPPPPMPSEALLCEVLYQ